MSDLTRRSPRDLWVDLQKLAAEVRGTPESIRDLTDRSELADDMAELVTALVERLDEQVARVDGVFGEGTFPAGVWWRARA